MTENIQKDAEAKAKADAEAKAKADAEAGNQDQDQDDKDDDQDPGSSSKTIDYKKLADDERTRREAAEALIAGEKFKKKHKKEEEDNEDDEDEDDKPVSRKELSHIINTTTQKAREDANKERIAEIATELAETPEEAEYLVELHKGRMFPSYLSLKEQMEEVHAIAFRKQNSAKISELVRALKGKDGASKDVAGTQRDPQKGTAPKVEAKHLEILKRNGYALDTTDRLYKKKLPNGKILIFNPVTKQTSLQ